MDYHLAMGSKTMFTGASKQGLLFQGGRNEYNTSCAAVKTEHKVSQQVLDQCSPELQNSAHFLMWSK